MTSLLSTRFVHDDGPRCGGNASPEVIDTTCEPETAEHVWKRGILDYEYGERTVYCENCGREV